MTQPVPPLFIPSPPTPAQFALALLVLKSMPIGWNLDDHISQLRQCVQSETRLSSRHLDGCAFWKHSYEKSETAQSDLLNKIYERDQQIEQLRSDLRRPQAAEVQAGVKRKRSVKPAANHDRNCKRISTHVNPSKSQGEKRFEATDRDFEGSEDLASTAFAAAFFALRQSLSARGSVGKMLLMGLRRICTLADEMLSASARLSFPPTAKTQKATEVAQRSFRDFVKMPNVLCLCYPSLLRAIEKLSPEEGGADNGVFGLVQLFQQILGQLHAISAKKAGATARFDKNLDRDKPGTIQREIFSESDLNEMCVALTKLAVHFFETLDPSQVAHNRLLEGLITVFLDHLGSSISLVVFTDVELAGPKDEPNGVHPPCGILDTTDLDQEHATRTTEYEACYLTTILRRLMLYLDKKLSLMESDSHLLLSLTKSPATTNSAFAASIREKLQNTLLRGVFGDDDEAFKDALRRSVVNGPDTHVDLEIDGRKGTAESFIGEVWKYLGWSILAGTSDRLNSLVPSFTNHS